MGALWVASLWSRFWGLLSIHLSPTFSSTPIIAPLPQPCPTDVLPFLISAPHFNLYRSTCQINTSFLVRKCNYNSVFTLKMTVVSTL